MNLEVPLGSLGERTTKFLTVRFIGKHLLKKKIFLNLYDFQSNSRIFVIYTPTDLSFKIIFIDRVTS